MQLKLRLIIILFVVYSCDACKKYLTVPPPTDRLVTASVFTTEAGATSAILGMYEQMMENNAYLFNGGVTLFAGLSADELVATSFNPDYAEFYANQITISNYQLLNGIWGPAYKLIYQANDALVGLDDSPITDSLKRNLQGEAKFVRAFTHFYLVNLFGPVPLITTTNYLETEKLPRNSRDSVYSQIVKDLLDASALLPESYVDNRNQPTSTDRIRPNKAAVYAMLARVYLYLGDWSNAEKYSTLLINQTDFFNLNSDLNQVFLAASRESIWQLLPVSPGYNTGEGYMFVQDNGFPLFGYLDSSFLRSFETADQRYVNWVGNYLNGPDSFYYPAKYKVNYSSTITENYTVLRLAEQYLIRSEARNEQQNLSGSTEDLNIIRLRAGLPATQAKNYPELKLAIQDERRHELFCEWGHRWMDLKRSGTVDQILISEKPGWQPTDSLYPIPRNELMLDPNLLQNPGY